MYKDGVTGSSKEQIYTQQGQLQGQRQGQKEGDDCCCVFNVLCCLWLCKDFNGFDCDDCECDCDDD